MYKDKSFLAIIPARGQSKRLPRKNMLVLNGKPLLTWSINAGLESKYIDKVVVSSDDDEIIQIASKYDVGIVKRPDVLASDTASTFETLKHAIENCDKFDYIILLQATSPLRNAKHIDKAIELLDSKNAEAIVSVCETSHTPLWSNVLPEDGSMNNFLTEDVINKRSQDLEVHYQLNGAIYICNTDRFLSNKSFFLKEGIYAFKMQKIDSIDIDDKLDFIIAESLMQERN